MRVFPLPESSLESGAALAVDGSERLTARGGANSRRLDRRPLGDDRRLALQGSTSRLDVGVCFHPIFKFGNAHARFFRRL